jgi:hypothetical protein
LTHLDALGHIPEQGRIYPGHDLNAVATSDGLQHSSTTTFAGGIITRGVLLDLAPENALPPGHPITAADLDTAAERAGIAIRAGDGLVVRGGWSTAENIGHRPTPGMTLDAVRWLDHHQISLYLGDVGDAHPPVEPDPTWPLPLHQVGLARLGLPLVDNEPCPTCSQPVWISTRTALTRSVPWVGQLRILRRIFQLFSWAFARSPGPR